MCIQELGLSVAVNRSASPRKRDKLHVPTFSARDRTRSAGYIGHEIINGTHSDRTRR
jgi:hypothetical protein